MKKHTVGVIGCGDISGIYLENCKKLGNVEVVACSDLNLERAKAAAEKYGVRKSCPVDELLQDHQIEIVLNLTVPKAHATVSLQALDAGKHVYSEKPLSTTRNEAKAMLDAAQAKSLLVGCAPDTFLGGGLQTARELIDSGAIGRPVSAVAFMVSHGWESWHPNPFFYYEEGGGPTLDMGPYYLTALVSMLGPVKRVGGMCSRAFEERSITSEPFKGRKAAVEVTTHDAGLLEFASGAIGTLIMSFDVWRSDLPRLEIHGTEGSLSLPDPNTFGGPLQISRAGADWEEVPITKPFTENSRGLGLSDLAGAIDEARHPKASGQLAFHVLDVMQSIHESSDKGQFREIRSRVERPEPL